MPIFTWQFYLLYCLKWDGPTATLNFFLSCTLAGHSVKVEVSLSEGQWSCCLFNVYRKPLKCLCPVSDVVSQLKWAVEFYYFVSCLCFWSFVFCLVFGVLPVVYR